jgi:hypothetical protein
MEWKGFREAYVDLAHRTKSSLDGYIYPDSMRRREKGLKFSAGGIRMAS